MKKVVIITGAGSGIGKATAEMLADKGFAVYGVDKNKFASDKITALCADVNDYDAMAKIFETVCNDEGHIDALINNAGFGIAGAIEDAEIVNIQNIVNTNSPCNGDYFLGTIEMAKPPPRAILMTGADSEVTVSVLIS